MAVFKVADIHEGGKNCELKYMVKNDLISPIYGYFYAKSVTFKCVTSFLSAAFMYVTFVLLYF